MALKKLSLLFIAVVLLNACTTAEPLNYPTTISSLFITATEAATQKPSSTPSVTPTINLTSTVIYQKDLTAFANANATYSMQETLVPRFTRICENLYGPREISPNGLWLVEYCYSPSDQDLTMTFSKKDTLIVWKLSYQDYIPQMDFVPDGGLSVVHWSKDERYVYVLSHLGGDGGECFYKPRERGSGLFRLDLKSGWITTILRPNSEFWWYSFSFSPTDRRLVYGEQARDLKFLDLTNSEISQIISEESNYETGGYLWSSDGLQLAYSVLARNEQGEGENYSLRLADVQTGSERILLNSPDNCFSAISWASDSILIIERQGRDGRAIIHYDLSKNNIVSESPVTPYP